MSWLANEGGCSEIGPLAAERLARLASERAGKQATGKLARRARRRLMRVAITVSHRRR